MKSHNLHINIDDIGGVPMARTPSNSSTTSSNPPQTPINQTITTPILNRQFMFHRLNSVSSIATSEDDSDFNTTRLDNPLDSFLDWADPDDDLLMNVYQSFLDNLTTNAPFAGKIPPSGVVHQVAKATLHEAKKQGRPFLHSFIAVRKRLLLLCERHSAGPPVYTRQLSTSSLSSTSSFTFNTPEPRYFRQLSFGATGPGTNDSLMTPLANRIKKPGSMFMNNDVSSTFMLGHPDDEDDTNMEDSVGMSLLPPPPHFKIPELDRQGRLSPFERRGRGNSPTQSNSNSPSLQPPSPSPSNNYSQTQQNIANWLLSTPNHNQTSAQGMLTPASTPYNNKPPPPTRTAPNHPNLEDFDFGLDSPFKEMTVTPTRQHHHHQQYSPTPPEDPYPNYTAQRKRESLRMKRGLKASASN